MHDALLPRAQEIAHHIRNTNYDAAVEVIIDLIVNILTYALLTGFGVGFLLALFIQVYFGG